MSHDFLPFSLPDIGDEEIAEVVDALRSGWITTGPKTKRFESEFSQFIGGNVEAIAVNSATAGLHLALEAVGVGPGDEVLTVQPAASTLQRIEDWFFAHLPIEDEL